MDIENLDTAGANEELPSLALSSSNLLETTNTNSLPSKPTFTTPMNSQPDILTHSNYKSNETFNISQDFDQQNQTSVADKKSISSLYVDMIPENFTQNKFSHHEVSNSNAELSQDDKNIVSIPVFVTFLRIPINNVHSSLNTVTWNRNREIRLGTKDFELSYQNIISKYYLF